MKVFTKSSFIRKEDNGNVDMETILRRACISARANYFSAKPENRDPSLYEYIQACENFVLSHASNGQIMRLVEDRLMRKPSGAHRAYINLSV